MLNKIMKCTAILAGAALTAPAAFAQTAAPVDIVDFDADAYVTAAVGIAVAVTAGLVGIKVGKKFLGRST